MSSITSADVSGVGQTVLGVVEGTWVVGFFQDGEDVATVGHHGDFVQRVLFLWTRKGSDRGFQDTLNGNYSKYTETDVNQMAVNDTNKINFHSNSTKG